ncbi:tape measure protein [Mycobacterium phage Knocker]|nr:tape measure protein [Mycobacterium phage Knocker]
MTDVGKISLGVEIDADDLSAKLGDAVRRAIAPALERIQSELNAVQREYDATAAASKAAANQQVRDHNRVAKSADKAAEAIARARAAAMGSGGGVQRRWGRMGGDFIVNNITNNYRYTTNNRTNNVTNIRNDGGGGGGTGGGGGSGGGGSGGGGPVGGRHAGGFMRGGQGRFGFLTSPVGLSGLALGAQALPAVATGVTNIVGAVQQLGQAGLALPGIFAGAATSIGTAVIAFKGVGEATKTLSEALKTGDPKDLEKAKEAMEDMAPAGVAVAETLAKLNRGPLLEFRKGIQQTALDGFDKSLQGLADKALPRASAGMGKVAGAWNNTLKTLTGSLGSDQSLSFMDRIFGNTAEGQNRANKAIGPLVSAMGQLAATGSDFLPRLGDGLAKVSERFNSFIQRNAANGNLWRWIDEGLNGMRAFGNALLNVGKTITGLTRAAGQLTGSLSGDGGFLGWLERSTDAMQRWTNSTEGQNKLGAFFRDGREDMETWGTVLADIAQIIGHLVDGFATWGDVLLPLVGALANVVETLGDIPGLLEAVVVGFLAWRTIGPIISGLTTKLGAMGTAAAAAGVGGAGGAGGQQRRGARIAGALGSTRGTLGLTGLLAGSATQLTAEDTSSKIMGALGTIGGGALTGAAIGSVIPGLGTAVGAGVGTAVGTALAGVNFLLGENRQKSEEAAAAADKLAEANQRAAEGAAANRAAQKELFDTLLSSGGAMDAGTNAAIGAQIEAIPEKLAGSLSEDQLKALASDMAALGMTTDQMATIVSGSQPQFDALVANLSRMGPEGQRAASELTNIRNSALNLQTTSQTLAPVLQQLSAAGFGSVEQAAVAVQNAFRAIPQNVPIEMTAPGAQAVVDIIRGVGGQVDIVNGKPVVLNANDQAVKDAMTRLEALGIKITTLPTGNIQVQLDPMKMAQIDGDMRAFFEKYGRLTVGVDILPGQPAPLPPGTIAPTDLGGLLGAPPRAMGGVLPGYSPRVDNMLVPLGGGEGIIIPEAMRYLGADWLYSLNSRFRPGISRQGYADGGVHLGTGALPGPAGPDTELSVLISIRDILAGKGGAASNPIAATASNTATAAKAATDSTGTQMGPFGTPLKKRGNPGYEMAAAALSALGADPEEWIGADPSTYVPPGVATAGLPGAVTGTTVDVAALQKFAMTGNTADLPPGIDINSPVVTAITAARNKKKGGLTDQGIADIVGQSLAPGGFSGTLDETNTSLVKALEKLRTKGVPGTTAPGGYSPVAGSTGVSMTSLPGGMTDPISAFAASVSGGKYSWGASDLAQGLSDCSGAVSDLVEIITKGQADPGRLFATGSARDVLSKLGAVEGAIPGALQIGWDEGHMASTLPNGVNFESGGGTGQGATYGGNAKGAAGFPNIMSLPVNGMPLVPGMSMPGMSASGLPGAAGGQGTPVYVTNWPGGGGGLPPGVQQVLGAGLSAAGGAAGTVATDITGAIGGLGQEDWVKRAPDAEFGRLVRERNPMALAAALGFNVQDFTRQGGAGGEVEKNDAAFDASGRMFSDTGALMDRTMTSLNAQLQAMREQLVDVITQVQQRLEEQALEPVVKAGVQSALESLKDSVSGAIGTALGNAAAPPIAEAVSSAVSSLPIDQSGAGNVGNNAASPIVGALAQGFAGGGPVFGGVRGKDSVPALLQHGEYVLDTGDVMRLGGIAAIDAMRSRGFRRYATGGGVIANDVVGAEFFGVSEVPIVSTIVNLLIRVLLQVLGVEIEARDTLNEMTDEFRGFRGDAFKAFDATGRLMNDTSALIDRSASSEETAAAERIRILKIVIQALIKYIIEKVIVPITKAVANAAIQAGASAAGAAVNTQAPGAGGIVSSLISSAGQAGVEIAAEVGTDFALAISEQLIATVAEGLQSQFPDLMTGIFSGAGAATLFNPLGTFLTTILGGFLGSFSALLGGGLGGASTLIPGIPFDSGGMAHGVGYLPKATMDDELVLSPGETDLFGRFVSALERGGFGRGGNTTHVSAPITVVGGTRETADEVQDRLLALMP